MADCSVDAIVTDPPYGLSFMGKRWDYDVPSVEIWAECLRVLKPGGHLLAFAGTRTQHRMAVRIEDAGFEIRDMIAWVYGSAARFFYCAKASKRDRDEGLEGFARSEAKSYEGGRIVSGDHPDTGMGGASVRANIHPTVKPTDLMAYLCRLVTPPGGVVLDPFMGSGSTGKAAVREGFRFVGCELSPEYLAIARSRIEHEVAAIEAARAAAAPAPAP